MKRTLFIMSLILAVCSFAPDSSALLTPGPDGTVECIQATTGQPCEETIRVNKAQYFQLLKKNMQLTDQVEEIQNLDIYQELEAYKALETFWFEQALGMPAPVMAESLGTPATVMAKSPVPPGCFPCGLTVTM